MFVIIVVPIYFDRKDITNFKRDMANLFVDLSNNDKALIFEEGHAQFHIIEPTDAVLIKLKISKHSVFESETIPFCNELFLNKVFDRWR